VSTEGDPPVGSPGDASNSPGDASKGLLTEIDHVAIAVHDLEAALDYYRTTFGAGLAHRERIETDGVEEALIKVADSYIHLVSPTRADSRWPSSSSGGARGSIMWVTGWPTALRHSEPCATLGAS
jgi:catechol-2,3-dioxygenase